MRISDLHKLWMVSVFSFFLFTGFLIEPAYSQDTNNDTKIVGAWLCRGTSFPCDCSGPEDPGWIKILIQAGQQEARIKKVFINGNPVSEKADLEHNVLWMRSSSGSILPNSYGLLELKLSRLPQGLLNLLLNLKVVFKDGSTVTKLIDPGKAAPDHLAAVRFTEDLSCINLFFSNPKRDDLKISKVGLIREDARVIWHNIEKTIKPSETTFFSFAPAKGFESYEPVLVIVDYDKCIEAYAARAISQFPILLEDASKTEPALVGADTKFTTRYCRYTNTNKEYPDDYLVAPKWKPRDFAQLQDMSAEQLKQIQQALLTGRRYEIDDCNDWQITLPDIDTADKQTFIGTMVSPLQIKGTISDGIFLLNQSVNKIDHFPKIQSFMYFDGRDILKPTGLLSGITDISRVDVCSLVPVRKSGNESIFVSQSQRLVRFVQAASEPSVVHAVITVCKNPPLFISRYPVPSELTAMVYSAISGGARGIVYRNDSSLSEQNALVGKIQQLNREIRAIRTILCGSFPTEAVNCSDDKVRGQALYNPAKGMAVILLNHDIERPFIDTAKTFSCNPRKDFEVSIKLPDDFTTEGVFEIHGNDVTQLKNVSVQKDKLTFMVNSIDSAKVYIVKGIQEILGSPKLFFQPETLDFGQVKETDEPEESMILANIGSGILDIYNIRSSCDECLEVRQIENSHLKPGDATEISLVLKPEYIDERDYKAQIIIFTNDRKNPSQAVSVTATLLPDMGDVNELDSNGVAG